ncbi:MAG: HlyU family transcriptional regulator [Granulosicoccus sp.]
MGLGSLFGKLFGSGNSAEPASTAGDPVDYIGFTITPAPIAEGGQYRTAGTISREQAGELLEVQFIRADVSSDLQAALDHSIKKGRQIIDEQGESVLQRQHA